MGEMEKIGSALMGAGNTGNTLWMTSIWRKTHTQGGFPFRPCLFIATAWVRANDSLD
jgi:hypothetical protein